MWDIAKGQHFRKLRIKAGYSQTELAKAIGYSTKQAIYYVESGKQEPSARFRINSYICLKKRFPKIKINDIFLD